MPLSGDELLALVEKGSLVILPFDRALVGVSSVALRMGTQFIKLGETHTLCSAEIGRPITLEPHRGILSVTLETIQVPEDLCALVTVSRIGVWCSLIMNSTFVDPGFHGKLGIALSNPFAQAKSITAGQPVVELAFFPIGSRADYQVTAKLVGVRTRAVSAYGRQQFAELRNTLAHSAEKIRARTKTEDILGELLRSALTADAKEKGKLLENLTTEILRTIKGLKILDVRRRLRAEEIDIIVQNNVVEGFWRTIGSPIVVECKNWSGKVSAKEIGSLADKMLSMSPDVRLGLLIAPNGVTGDYRSDGILKIREKRQRGLYIVVLTKEDLDEIASGTHAATVIEKKFDQLFLI